jgi:CheY-like chemotaxis protein
VIGSGLRFLASVKALQLRLSRPKVRWSHYTAMQKLICVVDDDKAFRLLCARVLEPAGYSCVSIDDGRRTLEEVKRIRPDLLMMDLRLGELDGLEVLNALDADPEVTGIPVVICTAAHDLVERHR